MSMKRECQRHGWHQDATCTMSMRMTVRLPAARMIANMTQREDQWASWIVRAALTGTVGSCTIRHDVMSTMSMRMVVRLPAARTIVNITRREDQCASWIVSALLKGTEGSCRIRPDEYDVDENRMPAAWMTSRHDKYDIHEDDSDTTGSKDDRK